MEHIVSSSIEESNSNHSLYMEREDHFQKNMQSLLYENEIEPSEDVSNGKK